MVVPLSRDVSYGDRVVILAWLLPAKRTVGNIAFDVDTIVYAIGGILVGFHACIFAVSAKIFGISEGLLPRDPRVDRWFRYISLETGLSVGATLIAIGLGTTLYAVSIWYRSGFGNLSPAEA